MSKPSLTERPARHRPQVRVLRAVMRANAALREAHKDFMQKLGTNIVEFDFLAALGNTEGLRMKDLANAMITTPSNVTRVCTTMEKKGLALRERSSESDREVIARLTPKGQKRFEDLFPKVASFTTETMDTLMGENELTSLAEALEELLRELRPRD